MFLSDAVSSVVSQSFADWEIIIVNDGSADDTTSVVQQLQQRYPTRQIKFVDQYNSGASATRNVGFRLALGTYILPLDADDKIAPDFLSQAVSVLDSDPSTGFVYSHIQHFGTDNRFYYIPQFDPETEIHTDNIIPTCSLVRRTVWEEVGGYNEEMKDGYEDWDFWISCIEKGFKGYRVDAPLFYYRKRPDSTSPRANRIRSRLISRIVLNHPHLYSEKRKIHAERILSSNSSLSRLPRVVLICPYFAPSTGGLEKAVEDLGVRLCRQGYSVYVATWHLPDRVVSYHRGITIIPLSDPGSPGSPSTWMGEIRQIVMSGEFDACILFADPMNNFVWSLLDAEIPESTKLIIQLLINKEGYSRWEHNPIFRDRLASILKNATACLALTSDGIESKFLRSVDISPVLIPNAVDPLPPANDFRKIYGIPDSQFMILHVANLWPVKNHLGLLRALEGMNQGWKLVMIGYPPYHDSQSPYVQEVLGSVQGRSDVLYIPGLDSAGISAAMQACDVFVLPSHGEVSPLVVLEAMAHARPWVVTPQCGSASDLAGGAITALEGFRDVLSVLSRSPDLRKRLGKLGQLQWQTSYRWEHVIEAWKELVDQGTVSYSFEMPDQIRTANRQCLAELDSALRVSFLSIVG